MYWRDWKFFEFLTQLLYRFFQHLFVLSFCFLKLGWPRIIMIVNKADIVCWSFFSIEQPFFTLIHYFVLLQIEMSFDNILKTFGRISHVINHSEFDVRISHYIRISFIFLFALWGTLLAFEARFIEINLLTHNNCLYWK